MRNDQTLRIAWRAELFTPCQGLERNRPRLVVVVGENVGEVHSLSDGAIVGRALDATIRIPSDDVSRRHARFRVRDGQHFIEDLGSMNGTRVNGVRVDAMVPLREGDKIQIGTTILRFALFDDLDEKFQERMYESALRDPLTRAFNRKYLEERIDSEFAYALRHDTPLALVLFDIDHFKVINDTWGHLAGDAVLRQLADHVSRAIRAEDVLARYGGEEFVILSRGIDRGRAHRFAERLRGAIAGTAFIYETPSSQGVVQEGSARAVDGGQRIALTISVGVATVPDPEIGQPIQLFERADEALYRAKAEGRNCVRVHGVP